MDDAEAIWNDLRDASPSADLVAEGQIVAAGGLADQGDLAGAMMMLARAGGRRVLDLRSDTSASGMRWRIFTSGPVIFQDRELFGRVAAQRS